jgi:predicted molibdopterin-dependent oxidoreductase YjgC
MMVIGTNPTDAHPVFASRMKQRLRKGAKLIVLDPRRIDLVGRTSTRSRRRPRRGRASRPEQERAPFAELAVCLAVSG